ncbi:XdhC family protein [Flavobacterium limnophilum]|uniref:XdhC family protein n=1 Tax=Flavobacterium limnophilum TaxID=3003262 RepID=UPI002482B142|nr:XdhC/CoxI family protein [Flavobacterium limnophilum]
MTFEFKNCINSFVKANKKGLKTVMATLVALEGSSYRKPGVRMLVLEDGTMTGALSGGCVEKEILKQSESVFQTNQPKMMTYDGRYRLGCEGTLYILIEPFLPDDALILEFEKALEQRKAFQITTSYSRQEGVNDDWGSFITFDTDNGFGFSKTTKREEKGSGASLIFEQQLEPCFRLVIVGAEHDAVQLCLSASILGWEVVIITTAANPKTALDFPGIHQLLKVEPNELQLNGANQHTAIVLMTHSYAKDLQYLMALKETRPAYIGLLGAMKRGQKLINDFVEHHPLVEEDFLDTIHGPAGLNIGAQTPQEIAISICSEILAVTRQQKPDFLKNKRTSFYSN